MHLRQISTVPGVTAVLLAKDTIRIPCSAGKELNYKRNLGALDALIGAIEHRIKGQITFIRRFGMTKDIMETTHQPSKLNTAIITYFVLYLCSMIFYVLTTKDAWRVLISVIGVGVGIWIGIQLRDGRYVFLSKKTVKHFMILFVVLILLLVVGCIVFGELINASAIITSSGPLFASTFAFHRRKYSTQSSEDIH